MTWNASSAPIATFGATYGLILMLALSPASAQSTLATADSQASTAKAGDLAAATADTMVDIGTAMFSYLTDFVSLVSPLSGFGGPDGSDEGEVGFCVWSGPPFERSSIPTISHADLEALLVPGYIDTLPQFDAWGFAFEFGLQEGIDTPYVAVLSPGADGMFDGSASYTGGYNSAPEDDLVWADGVFVRRPPVEPEDYRRQVVDVFRTTGTALMSWLTDQIGRSPGPEYESISGQAVAGPPTVTLDLGHLTPHATILGYLIPTESFYYTRCVPETDPWGRDYEYFVNPSLLASQVMAIRSAGADGSTEGETYTFGPVYDPDGDLVWSDGIIVRVPIDALFADGFESSSTSDWSSTTGELP